VQQVRAVLAYLTQQNLTLATFLRAFLWGDPECVYDPEIQTARTYFCGDPLLPAILEVLYEPPRTNSGPRSAGASSTVQSWALARVWRSLEMELDAFSATLNDPGLSQENISAITMDALSASLQRFAPGVRSFLWGLAQTKAQAERNIRKDPTVVSLLILSCTVTIIACQLAYSRNTRCNKFQQIISLYMKSKSIPSKCMELIHHFGLAMSYSWACKNVTRLRDDAFADLHHWLKGHGVFILHDNIRLVFRVKTQRVNNQTHGDNGTAATAVALPDAATEILSRYGELMRPKWAEMHAAFADESPQPIRMLSLGDLTRLGRSARIREFAVHNVITVLLASPEFSQYRHQKHPSLQPPPPIHALPTGPKHRTKYWMLGTVPIEEATYSGNLQVVDEILRQTGLNKGANPEKLAIGNMAIPWGGDQLTDSRLKILKWFRAEDINGFERMEWLVNFFGWFHTLMLLANAIYNNHRGSTKDFGLARDVGLLHIRGLAANKEKPMFHTIDDMLHLEHTARVRTGWLWASGAPSLDTLFSSLDADPTGPTRLHQLAEKIVDERSSSAALVPLRQKATRDFALEGSVLLMRDLDLYIQLRQAIREGDVGRMHHMVPHLIFYFKGGSNGNYCKMLIEYMQWHFYEAPPEVSEVIRNHCWLVNPSGRPGHFHPADQLQEHCICGAKCSHCATSSNATWSYVTKISPAIPTLNHVANHIDRTFNLIHGSRHTEPDAEKDLQLLMKSYQTNRIFTHD
ncbi:hypothetical protein BOTBODRAFT_84965, partial [Botryobasidium botryosum FD-172 SS1]